MIFIMNNFIIYTAKSIIKNFKYQQMILDFFKIGKNYLFEYDEHYQLNSSNGTVKKITKTKVGFNDDESLTKLV